LNWYKEGLLVADGRSIRWFGNKSPFAKRFGVEELNEEVEPNEIEPVENEAVPVPEEDTETDLIPEEEEDDETVPVPEP